MKALVVLLVFLVLVCVVLYLVLYAIPGHTPSPRHSAGGARLACQGFVKRELVAPATARFSDEDAGLHLGRESAYEVLGNVDSQNRLGALLRQRYLCIVEYRAASDSWYLESLDWLK